jgi:antitoxin CcdA
MLDAPNSSKRATNLTLNAKVLDAARELGINISQTVDDLLAKEVRRRTVLKWAEENASTVEAYNKRIQESGLWNEDLRKLRGQI